MCSCSRWHSTSLPCSLLGSRRCQCAHAVDGIQLHCRAACLAYCAGGVLMQPTAFDLITVQLAWLTGPSACSCSRWHSTSLPCILVVACFAYGAVGVLMQSMAFIFAAVQLAWLTALSACSCSRWHSTSLPCSLLGSRGRRLAHAVDGIHLLCRAAWL